MVCLFSSIGYLGSTDELNAAVGAMADHLDPGGVLIIDGWVRPDAWIDGGRTQVTTAVSDEVTVVRLTRSRRQERRTFLEMHYLVATEEGVEYLVEDHGLTLFAPADYEEALRRSDLVFDVVDSPVPARDGYVGTRIR